MRFVTQHGRLVEVPSERDLGAFLHIPADCLIVLPAVDEGNDAYFVFDKRSLVEGAQPPPPPPAPPVRVYTALILGACRLLHVAARKAAHRPILMSACASC